MNSYAGCLITHLREVRSHCQSCTLFIFGEMISVKTAHESSFQSGCFPKVKQQIFFCQKSLSFIYMSSHYFLSLPKKNKTRLLSPRRLRCLSAILRTSAGYLRLMTARFTHVAFLQAAFFLFADYPCCTSCQAERR